MEPEKIYTHNVAADIVELFEDLLVKNNIVIPDEDRTGGEEEAAIYGMTYAGLLEDVENELINVLKEAKIKKYVPWVFK